MPRPLDEKVLQDIKSLPDVEQVAGQINDVAAVVGKDGKIVSTGGAPTIAATYMPPPFAPIGFTEGRPPKGEGEIALDAATADKEDFKLGDEVTVATSAPKRAFKLVGLATIGQSTGLGGATFVVFDLPTAQKLFDKQGKVDFAFVAGRDGVTQTELQRSVASLLPPTAQVRTAAQEADKLGDDIREGLSFLTTGLLAFAFIAVLVGAFLIFNTFSITVAQRSRELALLRTLGATRRQVLNSVLLEALTIGLIGSVVGIVAGLGFAKGINALFKALGIDLPTTSLVLESRTIIVCLLVGTLVTLAGALAPALRATRVAPVEALREATAPTHGRWARLTPWLAGGLVLLGAGLVVAGLLAEGGDTSTKLLGAAGGAVILILGIALISPRFVGPAARFVSVADRALDEARRAARARELDAPSRPHRGHLRRADDRPRARRLRDGVRQRAARLGRGPDRPHARGRHRGAPRRRLLADPGGDRAGGGRGRRRQGRVVAAGHAGRDQGRRRHVQHARDRAGDAERGLQLRLGGRLRRRRCARSATTASCSRRRRPPRASSRSATRIDVIGPSGNVSLTVRGIYKDDALLGGLRHDRRRRSTASSIRSGSRASSSRRTRARACLRCRSASTRRSTAFPEARARSQEELKQENADQVNQLLGLFYALLAMSVIISAFGIVNTLTLSIFERTRELGLLRAVGMTRRDVRRMVRYESVITALFGALLGLVLGLFFAFVVIQALEGEGITFSLPIGQIVSLMVFAIVVGVVAAIFPARRASRLDVLRAISYE